MLFHPWHTQTYVILQFYYMYRLDYLYKTNRGNIFQEKIGLYVEF